MNETETGHKVIFEADASPIRDAIKQVNIESLNLGQSITKSFEDIIFKGKDVESVFKSLALQLSNKAFNSAIKPAQELLPEGVGNSVGSLFGSVFGFAKGGAFANSGGGVLNSPLAFPLAGGNLGVAGEAGPEAILPLTRGANGELGVRSAGGSGVNVTVNIAATDIDSFRRSEGEIAATLQRITSRGNRNL
ncbi:phage tail tape measure protein [Hyphomicrobiales bacterium 4NK60-0047b]|jgi:phage-related minor tail protein